jgi:hypothetical protein
MIEQKILDAVQIELQNLAIKKLWKINYKGVKVKVRRSGETVFEVYRNGHFVTTDTRWETVFGLVKVLLQ